VVLAQRGVRAPAEVQHALTAFDEALAEYVEAVNANKAPQMAAATERLEAARPGVSGCIRIQQRAITPHLARHMLPWRVRTWRRLRGQSIDYL
jgi:hypothetical protein